MRNITMHGYAWKKLKYKFENVLTEADEFYANNKLMVRSIYVKPEEVIHGTHAILNIKKAEQLLKMQAESLQKNQIELKCHGILKDFGYQKINFAILADETLENIFPVESRLFAYMLRLHERNEGSTFVGHEMKKAMSLLDADGEIIALFMGQHGDALVEDVKEFLLGEQMAEEYENKPEELEDKIMAFLNENPEPKQQTTFEAKPIEPEKKEVSAKDFIKEHIYIIDCTPKKQKATSNVAPATNSVASEPVEKHKIVSLEEESINKSLEALNKLAADFRIIEAKKRQNAFCIVK